MFDSIFDAIEEWMRDLLTGMVTSNLTTMFTDRVEQQHIQHGTKPVQFGDRTHSRDHHYDGPVL